MYNRKLMLFKSRHFFCTKHFDGNNLIKHYRKSFENWAELVYSDVIANLPFRLNSC